jgi:glycosyltransferase involved in cell wall biosynthesis
MSESRVTPLVSFILISYNQEKFIREAVIAALNQEYSQLEIIISDDHSSDSTFEIIKEIASDYSGPHNLVINRNAKNLGLARHFSSMVARAKGEIIVVAAGDDISLPHRALKTVEILRSNPEASFVSFTDVIIDEDGKVQKSKIISKPKKLQYITLAEYISGSSFPFSGASRGFRKKIFEVFGNLNEACPTEDTPYILRGLILGQSVISPDCGILYRKHDRNLSRPASLHNMNIAEIRDQYLKDAQVAYNSALITKEILLSINKWVEKNYRRRMMASNIFEKQRMPNFIFEFLASKDFSAREKIGILKERLLSDFK